MSTKPFNPAVGPINVPYYWFGKNNVRFAKCIGLMCVKCVSGHFSLIYIGSLTSQTKNKMSFEFKTKHLYSCSNVTNAQFT